MWHLYYSVRNNTTTHYYLINDCYCEYYVNEHINSIIKRYMKYNSYANNYDEFINYIKNVECRNITELGVFSDINITVIKSKLPELFI